MNMNLVVLGGRLTRDPQVKLTASQMAICEFGLVINEKRKQEEKAHFFDCTAFGKTAEMIGQHFSKGKEILIDGRLDYQTWEDRTTGNKRSKVAIIVNNFQFVGPKTDGGSTDDRPASRGGNRQRQQAGVGTNESAFDGQPNGGPAFDPADVPFVWMGRSRQAV